MNSGMIPYPRPPSRLQDAPSLRTQSSARPSLRAAIEKVTARLPARASRHNWCREKLVQHLADPLNRHEHLHPATIRGYEVRVIAVAQERRAPSALHRPSEATQRLRGRLTSGRFQSPPLALFRHRDVAHGSPLRDRPVEAALGSASPDGEWCVGARRNAAPGRARPWLSVEHSLPLGGCGTPRSGRRRPA